MLQISFFFQVINHRKCNEFVALLWWLKHLLSAGYDAAHVIRAELQTFNVQQVVEARSSYGWLVANARNREFATRAFAKNDRHDHSLRFANTPNSAYRKRYLLVWRHLLLAPTRY